LGQTKQITRQKSNITAKFSTEILVLRRNSQSFNRFVLSYRRYFFYWRDIKMVAGRPRNTAIMIKIINLY